MRSLREKTRNLLELYDKDECPFDTGCPQDELKCSVCFVNKIVESARQEIDSICNPLPCTEHGCYKPCLGVVPGLDVVQCLNLFRWEARESMKQEIQERLK